MPQWYQPMDYFRQGQEIAEPIFQAMRRKKAGQIASTLAAEGNYTDPAIADPMVGEALNRMLTSKWKAENQGLDTQLNQARIAQTLRQDPLSQSQIEANMARAERYRTLPIGSAGTPIKPTGNAGSLVYLTDRITDLQEQLADMQMNPDPDPDNQAKGINRIQNMIDEFATQKEILRKKLEREGDMPGSPIMTVTTDKEGNPKQTIRGSLANPEMQAFLEKKKVEDALAEQTFPERSMGVVTGVANMLAQQLGPKSSAPAPAATPTADKWIPGKIYQDASGNRRRYMGNGQWGNP